MELSDAEHHHILMDQPAGKGYLVPDFKENDYFEGSQRPLKH